ncbi:MAG: S8 family serine peptidase [Planctomycetota bacterium]
MTTPVLRRFVTMVCIVIGACLVAQVANSTHAQTNVPPDGLPQEEWVPTDPVPPGNEMRRPTTPGTTLLPTPGLPQPGPANPGTNNPPGAIVPTLPAPPPPSTAELLDYDDAYERLGDRMPDGSRVAIGIVEGDPGAYGPDLANAALRGLPLTLHSGPSQNSPHAVGVLQTLAGNRGLVGNPKAVGVWSVQHWMSAGFVQLGTPRPPGLSPDLGDGTPRVWSHSWIGTDADRAVPVLRRLDYAIDTDGLVMCVGVNNGKESAVPPMLGSGFNVIAVGVDDGNSSGGFTRVETDGRCKPDVVAPGNMTSFSTPAVAGVAALLIDFAKALHEGDDETLGRAVRPEVVKAAIMAGAQKHHRWEPLPMRPLDERLGAGRVNLDASLRIMEGGPIEPSRKITRGKAWAFAELDPRGTHRYTLDIPQDLGEFSVILTWHRRVDGRSLVLESETTGDRRALWHHEPRMADLDLRLVRIDGAGRMMSEFSLSASRIDNVEHLYVPALPEGRYALEVFRDPAADPMRDEPWTYGLAWRLEPPRDAQASVDPPSAS